MISFPVSMTGMEIAKVLFTAAIVFDFIKKKNIKNFRQHIKNFFQPAGLLFFFRIFWIAVLLSLLRSLYIYGVSYEFIRRTPVLLSQLAVFAAAVRFNPLKKIPKWCFFSVLLLAVSSLYNIWGLNSLPAGFYWNAVIYAQVFAACLPLMLPAIYRKNINNFQTESDNTFKSVPVSSRIAFGVLIVLFAIDIRINASRILPVTAVWYVLCSIWFINFFKKKKHSYPGVKTAPWLARLAMPSVIVLLLIGIMFSGRFFTKIGYHRRYYFAETPEISLTSLQISSYGNTVRGNMNFSISGEAKYDTYLVQARFLPVLEYSEYMIYQFSNRLLSVPFELFTAIPGLKEMPEFTNTCGCCALRGYVTLEINFFRGNACYNREQMYFNLPAHILTQHNTFFSHVELNHRKVKHSRRADVFHLLLSQKVTISNFHKLRLTMLNTSRSMMRNSSFQIMRSLPVLGAGPGNWKRAINDIKINPLKWIYHTYADEKFNFHPHNNFLLIGTENGIPALLFFIAAVCMVFFRGIRILKKKPDIILFSILLSLSGLLLCGLVDNTVWSSVSGSVFWFFLGAVTAAAKE